MRKLFIVLGLALLFAMASYYDMAGHNMTATAQDNGQQQPERDPDQSYDTPTHRYSPGDGCSAVDPNPSNPKRDGVEPNTVGCACEKKCVNGQVVEDRSRDEKGVYICKNACYTDRCKCTDPCKN